MYTKTEKRQLLAEIASLNGDQRSEFFARHHLGTAPTNKQDYRTRLEQSILANSVDYEDIIDYLDEVMPWGKQHVYLYKGPATPISNWKKASWVKELLRMNGLDTLVSKPIAVGLPEEMTISSVSTTSKMLRITAVRGRVWWERDHSLDEEKTALNGATVGLRAFIQRGLRSLVVFEWDLQSNVAMLQISQLHAGILYETVRDEFFELVAAWLPYTNFTQQNLHKVIANLHALEDKALEKKQKPIARSHALDYRTPRGGTISIRNTTGSKSVLGKQFVDDAMESIRDDSVGTSGSFFWLPKANTPITAETRIVIVANKNRVNFPTPNDEPVVRHILQLIRRYCFSQSEDIVKEFPALEPVVELVDDKLYHSHGKMLVQVDNWATQYNLDINQLDTVLKQMAKHGLVESKNLHVCPNCGTPNDIAETGNECTICARSLDESGDTKQTFLYTATYNPDAENDELDQDESESWDWENLNGPQLKLIDGALRSGYPDRSSLEQLLRYELSTILDEFSGDEGMKNTVFNVIIHFQARGQLKELVEAASAVQPENPKLKHLAEFP